MSSQLELSGELRENVGTGNARDLRRNKMIPCIAYGSGQEQLLFALPEKEISLLHRKVGFLTTVLDIKIGNKDYKVIPYDVQLHPVTDVIEHIDFMHVSAKSTVKVHVKIRFINQEKSIGIKRGGVLNIVRRDIEISCHPSDIPQIIDVDLSELNIGRSLHISDLKLSDKVKSKLPATTTIASITGRGASTDTGEEEAA
jgi:large subunit ribosomal protein L25